MQKSRTRKKWFIVVITAVVLLPVGYRVLQMLGDRLNEHLLDVVRFHEGTATVVKKRGRQV
jgi:hypothetical protein